MSLCVRCGDPTNCTTDHLQYGKKEEKCGYGGLLSTNICYPGSKQSRPPSNVKLKDLL